MEGGTGPKRLFFMIKPDGIPREATIRKMIEPLADILAYRLCDPVESSTIEDLYHQHRGKPFYLYLLDYFRGKPVAAFLLGEREGGAYRRGLYADFLELVGDTDPAKALPGTIRSMSPDSMERSLSEGRALRNLVHRSTTEDETAREASLFFRDYLHDRSKVAGEPGGLGRFFARKGDGIFFEERLEKGLQKYSFLASGERLVHYQDLGGRKGGPLQQERALLETIRDGVSSVREITLPSSVINDG